MDTEPGGESGQYEGNLGYVDPVAKQPGQLGGTFPQRLITRAFYMYNLTPILRCFDRHPDGG